MTTIFSISFLICLAIIFILVGGIFIYFNQKISQQNHKINGMFDLVNTMAEEMNYIRSSSGGGVTIQPFAPQTQQVLANLTGGFRQNENELIQVSDEEDDDEDEDEDDEDDEDEDEDDEDEDDEHDEDEDDDDEEDEDNTKNIKIINILSDSIYGVDHNDVEIIENENDDDEDDDDDEDNDLSNEDDEPVELIDLINHDVLEDHSNYNTFIKEEDPITISSNGENYSIDLNLLKTINISNSSSNENIDYKKMSLTKLREIVVERNLSTDASKMKKNELLKLLE